MKDIFVLVIQQEQTIREILNSIEFDPFNKTQVCKIIIQWFLI